MTAYMLGDLAGASVLFEKAAEASSVEPVSAPDTTALYNAGYTAWAVKDYDRAQKFFEKCMEIGYYYEGGEVFAKLADVYKAQGKNAESVAVLEKGFAAYPQSQSILIGLINYYIESGENADRLFVLIDEAKKNEPNNASLYYVEGNIYKELGNIEKAVESYTRLDLTIRKSVGQMLKIAPDYFQIFSNQSGTVLEIAEKHIPNSKFI